jgi:hypothetical protein
MDKMDHLFYKYKTKIIRYLKFGNARVRATESYGEGFFLGVPKN